MDAMLNPQKNQHIVCINCNISLEQTRRYLVTKLDTRVASLLSNWISPLIITDEDYLCHPCYNLAIQSINNQENCNEEPQHTHSQVCLLCGTSLLRERENYLLVRDNPSELHTKIINVIEAKAAPRQIKSSDRVCKACWQKSKRSVLILHQNPRAAKTEVKVTKPSSEFEVTIIQDSDPLQACPEEHHNLEEYSANPESNMLQEEETSHKEQPNPEDNAGQEVLETGQHKFKSSTLDDEEDQEVLDKDAVEENDVANSTEEDMGAIRLPNYRRASNTSSRCVFRSCKNRERHKISEQLRSIILSRFKFYLPKSARVCVIHKQANDWGSLCVEESMNTFTAEQVEHIFSMVSATKVFLDFSDLETIERIDDDLFFYWLGISKEHFLTILNAVPRVEEMHKGILGLAALLIKARTGDSDERLANLFKVTRTTLQRLMKIIHRIFLQDFDLSGFGVNIPEAIASV